MLTLNDSGFFNGTTPTHDDVAAYFTVANFRSMFGDDDLPTQDELDGLASAAHDEIDARIQD